MLSFEQPSSAPESRCKAPLYLRLYFQSHLTEIVRLIGYADVPVDEARERLEALVTRFGNEKIVAACQEILEVDTGKEPNVARLKAEVRRLAFQILGPPPKSVRAVGGSSATAPTISNEQSGLSPTTKPINMPRHYVMGQYEEHLAATKLQFTKHAELVKRTPCLELLPALDYVVVRRKMRLLVAVRPALRGSQAAQMIAYGDALLANHSPVRVWPVEGPSGWEWQEYVLLAEPLGIDPKRFKLSLDDWQIVHDHREGEKNCGRDWLKQGCACACCRAARSILTFSNSKRTGGKK